MITQYPGVSVKNQERKHIEIGAMITLLAAIVSFYSIPDFSGSTVTEKVYIPPPVEMLSIPATSQPPEILAPLQPTLPVASENEEIDDPVNEIIVGLLPGLYLEPPPALEIPIIPFWAAEIKPEPIGGWGAINKYVIYPPIAIEARQEGRVTVTALIGIDGVVKEVEIKAGLPGTGLNEAAMAAVLQTPFSPAYQRDKPVPVYVDIPINFKLK